MSDKEKLLQLQFQLTGWLDEKRRIANLPVTQHAKRVDMHIAELHKEMYPLYDSKH